MDYIKSTLLKSEKIILMRHPHRIIFFLSVMLFVLSLILFSGVISGSAFGFNLELYGLSIVHWLALCVFVYSVFSFIGAAIQYKFSEYVVTDKRVLLKFGMLNRVSLEVFLDKIEAIHVSQSIAGRIFNYGKLVVVGTGGSRDPFAFVPYPLAFRQEVQEQIDAYLHKK